MVNDINPSKTKGGPPPVDESWWAALLADEEKSHEPSIEYLNQKTEQEISSQQVCVNWSQAKMMFEQDETIDLIVTGYNRGGLLVEGEDIQGFVPISHLIELSGEKLDEDRDQLLSDYIGRSLLLKVIECDPDRGRVVLSEPC